MHVGTPSSPSLRSSAASAASGRLPGRGTPTTRPRHVPRRYALGRLWAACEPGAKYCTPCAVVGHAVRSVRRAAKETAVPPPDEAVLRPLARRVRRCRLLGRAGLRHGGRSRVRVRPADRQARTALCTTLRHHWCDRRRGRLMAESPSRGAMMSVRASPEAARRAVHEAGVAGRAAVACLNGPASVGCCGEYGRRLHAFLLMRPAPAGC